MNRGLNTAYVLAAVLLAPAIAVALCGTAHAESPVDAVRNYLATGGAGQGTGPEALRAYASNTFPGGREPTQLGYLINGSNRSFACADFYGQLSGSGESDQSATSNSAVLPSIYGSYGGNDYPNYRNVDGTSYTLPASKHSQSSAVPGRQAAAQSGLPPCCNDKLPCCSNKWPCCRKPANNQSAAPQVVMPGALPSSQYAPPSVNASQGQSTPNPVQNSISNPGQQANITASNSAMSVTSTISNAPFAAEPANTMSGLGPAAGASMQGMLSATGNMAGAGTQMVTGGGYAATDLFNRMMQAAAQGMPGINKEQKKVDDNLTKGVEANNLAGIERTSAAIAINFVQGYMENFTAGGGNQWNGLRNNLFVPMALLLFLPGAVLAQMKATVTQGASVLGEVSPFDGILRAVIAIFLIPATYLVINYGIDVANALTKTVSDGYTMFVGGNMFARAKSGHVRAFPIRLPEENFGVIPSDVDTIMFNYFGNGPFATLEGKLLGIKYENTEGLYFPPLDRADETVPWSVVIARLGYNGVNAGMAFVWAILCCIQECYLYYLWFVGPIVAALWVYPTRMLRQALPNWIDGVISLCCWSFFWSITILIMALVNGHDDTGTIMFTALNTLALLSVKAGFDSTALIKEAGGEVRRLGERAAMAMTAAGAGRTKEGGGGGGGGGNGPKPKPEPQPGPQPGPGPGPGPGGDQVIPPGGDIDPITASLAMAATDPAIAMESPMDIGPASGDCPPCDSTNPGGATTGSGDGQSGQASADKADSSQQERQLARSLGTDVSTIQYLEAQGFSGDQIAYLGVDQAMQIAGNPTALAALAQGASIEQALQIAGNAGLQAAMAQGASIEQVMEIAGNPVMLAAITQGATIEEALHILDKPTWQAASIDPSRQIADNADAQWAQAQDMGADLLAGQLGQQPGVPLSASAGSIPEGAGPPAGSASSSAGQNAGIEPASDIASKEQQRDTATPDNLTLAFGLQTGADQLYAQLYAGMVPGNVVDPSSLEFRDFALSNPTSDAARAYALANPSSEIAQAVSRSDPQWALTNGLLQPEQTQVAGALLPTEPPASPVLDPALNQILNQENLAAITPAESPLPGSPDTTGSPAGTASRTDAASMTPQQGSETTQSAALFAAADEPASGTVEAASAQAGITYKSDAAQEQLSGAVEQIRKDAPPLTRQPDKSELAFQQPPGSRESLSQQAWQGTLENTGPTGTNNQSLQEMMSKRQSSSNSSSRQQDDMPEFLPAEQSAYTHVFIFQAADLSEHNFKSLAEARKAGFNNWVRADTFDRNGNKIMESLRRANGDGSASITTRALSGAVDAAGQDIAGRTSVAQINKNGNTTSAQHFDANGTLLESVLFLNGANGQEHIVSTVRFDTKGKPVSRTANYIYDTLTGRLLSFDNLDADGNYISTTVA